MTNKRRKICFARNAGINFQKILNSVSTVVIPSEGIRACWSEPANQEEDALAEIYNQGSSAVYRVIKVLVKDEDTVYDIVTGYICKSIYQTGSASG